MSNPAATVAEQAIRSQSRSRRRFWEIVSVATLTFADIALAVMAFILAFKLRHGTSIFLWSRKSLLPKGIAPEFDAYLGLLILAPIVSVFALRLYGMYRLRGAFSFMGDFVAVFKATTLTFLILVLTAFLFRQGVSYRDGTLVFLDYSYSRLVFIYDWVISFAMFWAVRVVLRTVQTLYRYGERNLIPTIVVGCGEMARVCITEMAQKPQLGYSLVGVVAARASEDASAIKDLGFRIIGHFDNLPEMVKRYGIEEVLITDTRINPRKMFEVLMECGRNHHIKYRVIPNLFDCLPGKTEVATIGTLPMIKLYEEPLRGPLRAVKRGMDLAVAVFLLIITLPFWLVLYLLIKLESPGPALLRQERVGMDGKMFLMYKFRSMKDGADDRPHRELMAKTINGEDANQGTPDQPLYGKIKDDPRLTRLGAWMRRYSIDELPQMINVLKGEMSI
ncbi:MAG TPA: sugar transferase, partial [Blastocatellia bacterium]|nr:sugar transferase [Blastocatellia bacterium]